MKKFDTYEVQMSDFSYIHFPNFELKEHRKKSVFRLAKLNDFEILQCMNALHARVTALRTLYEELKTDILFLTDMQEQINMTKKQVLDLHKTMYNYWQSKDGIWHCYLPKEGVEPPKGRKIESVNKEKLDNKILDYYIKEEKKKQQETSPTFLEVYYMWRKIKDLELDDNSIYKYNTDCKRFFEGTEFAEMPINQINENTIRRFILETIKRLNLCKETCRKFFGYIKNVIRYARIEKIIIENPMEFLEVKDFSKHCVVVERSEKGYYTDDELAIILKALKDYYINTPTYMPAYAIELAIYTGMRVSELATLKWSDLAEGVISINKSAKHNRLKNEFSIGKTKTKKSRVYPIDEQITELLTRIYSMQTKYGFLCEWIFTDGNGGYTHARNITDCMTRICRENGLCGGGITKLRKTASSDLQAVGTPKPVVASMLGHTSEVNEKYYTYDTSQLDEKKEIIQTRNAKFKNLICAE